MIYSITNDKNCCTIPNREEQNRLSDPNVKE